MENLTMEKLLLDIPDFLPNYDKDTEYGYKNKPGENLEKLLRNTSRNHCMYCYSLLRNDRADIGNLEHSIEKNLDEKNLTECVPNIAIACPNCNQSLKRVGEKKRIDAMAKAKEDFESNLKCLGKQCKNECEKYKLIKKEYCKIAKLILQPFGVKGEQSGLPYRIQYDVYDAEFIPSREYDYDEEDRDYIEHHISQFKLNDTGYKTKALANFVADVIEADGKYRENSEYPNYIVDLFKEKIKDMSQEQVLHLCEQIHIKNIISFRI